MPDRICQDCNKFVNRREIPETIGIKTHRRKLPPENLWQKFFPKIEYSYSGVEDPERKILVGSRICSAKASLLTASGRGDEDCLNLDEFVAIQN